MLMANRHLPIARSATGFDMTVELDGPLALADADIRHRTKLKLMDACVLATAQMNGAVLITRNIRDFPPGKPSIHVSHTL